MEIDLVKGLGERRLTHPRHLQYLKAGFIAHDARLPRAGAQGVGDFGGPPMGVHVDHGCVLRGWAIA